MIDAQLQSSMVCKHPEALRMQYGFNAL